MDSNSKSGEAFLDDRISGLPDAILSHILSFLLTREVVKTSILSHRWKNQWALVPNLDFHEREYFPLERRLKNADPDGFAGFVDRVLFFRGLSNIHRFRLWSLHMRDLSRIDAWIRTALMCNVVELDLRLYASNPRQRFLLPRSLFTCKTLLVLKLSLQSDFVILTPTTSNCFPNLKFLHVDLVFADADLMGKLFSCCPALEDLIVEGSLGYLDYDLVLNFNISAPKLKRLKVSWYVASRDRVYDHRVLINANVPSLESFDLSENLLGNYSLKNAQALCRAKINLKDTCGVVRYLADHISRLFAQLVDVRILSLSAPVFGGPCSVYQYHLPTFHKLKHFELCLQTCCSLQSVTNFLQISPNLEHLVYENSIECFVCRNPDKSIHVWSPPDFPPICLLSHLKTICIKGFMGRPDEMKLAEYLLKHGEVLNTMTIYTLTEVWEELKADLPVLEMKEERELFQKISVFPMASKTCQIVFPRLK